MSCYAKHPDHPQIECWHGPGHRGDHGKEGRSWPNLEDPVQVELAKLREELATADGALALQREVVQALVDEINELKAEQARILELLETYVPRRDVGQDWSYQGALARIAEAVRAGKAP